MHACKHISKFHGTNLEKLGADATKCNVPTPETVTGVKLEVLLNLSYLLNNSKPLILIFGINYFSASWLLKNSFLEFQNSKLRSVIFP